MTTRANSIVPAIVAADKAAHNQAGIFSVLSVAAADATTSAHVKDSTQRHQAVPCPAIQGFAAQSKTAPTAGNPSLSHAACEAQSQRAADKIAAQASMRCAALVFVLSN